MSDKLAACPFCGGDARVTYSDRGEVWQVRCNNWTGNAGSTACMGGGAYADTEADAIAAWNRRPLEALVNRGADKEAEPMAWRWRNSSHGIVSGWFYSEERPSFAPYDLVRIDGLTPLYASPPTSTAEPVRVPELVWVQHKVHRDAFVARTPFGAYTATEAGVWSRQYQRAGYIVGSTLAEAKAAAQEHYSNAIRSALQPPDKGTTR